MFIAVQYSVLCVLYRACSKTWPPGSTKKNSTPHLSLRGCILHNKFMIRLDFNDFTCGASSENNTIHDMRVFFLNCCFRFIPSEGWSLVLLNTSRRSVHYSSCQIDQNVRNSTPGLLKNISKIFARVYRLGITKSLAVVLHIPVHKVPLLQ
jgi:hypothetical protein